MIKYRRVDMDIEITPGYKLYIHTYQEQIFKKVMEDELNRIMESE